MPVEPVHIGSTGISYLLEAGSNGNTGRSVETQNFASPIVRRYQYPALETQNFASLHQILKKRGDAVDGTALLCDCCDFYFTSWPWRKVLAMMGVV